MASTGALIFELPADSGPATQIVIALVRQKDSAEGRRNAGQPPLYTAPSDTRRIGFAICQRLRNTLRSQAFRPRQPRATLRKTAIACARPLTSPKMVQSR